MTTAVTASSIAPGLAGDIQLPVKPGQQLTWSNLHGVADALAVNQVSAAQPGLVLVITANSARAQRWQSALSLFAGPTNAPLHFPDWETLAYDAFSPHQDITSERLSTLRDLPKITSGVLTVPVTTLLQRISPPSYIAGSGFDFQAGQRLDIATQRRALDSAGYQNTDTVSERGQYAVRGSVLDIYPMGSELPVRLDLFDDEIDTLRTFDPDTQRTIEKIDRLDLLPAKEFPFNEAAIARFRDQWHNTFNVDVRRCSVYQDVSSGIVPNGIEYYLPFFFDELGTLFDFLPENVLLVVEEGVIEAAQHQIEDTELRYESLRHDIERPILPPRQLFMAIDELHAHLNTLPRINLSTSPGKHGQAFNSHILPELTFSPRAKDPAEKLKDFVAQVQQPILFVAESAGRREVFDELLRKAGIQTHVVSDFATYQQSRDHCISVAELDEGLYVDGAVIITEADVLGSRQTDPRREAGARVIDPDLLVRNLTELTIGAPVVHIEHGVGRYVGLQILTIDDEQHEFLTLIYADDAKLYVPVTSLHLISRYSGSDEGHAPLHRLGSDQWEKAKRKAAEKVVDVAAELLDIYARRELRTSFQFNLNQQEYDKFANEFPFEVTLDQQRAIEDTLTDMTTLRAMDRLICGDVGFGKTEVAMRAAFVAVQNGKQVAVLVPTTLLAQQHEDSFRDRFASWPVSVEGVSRLRSPAEIGAITDRLRSGKLDILIGTHKLLADDFKFKDLGLIVIDEEHRFGVRQKERLKAMRAEVDILTLTATPIPRTLNMSLSGIRDLSIIATPPAKRLSIKTFVQQKHKHQIKEAISRELARGGQVFLLHNEVRNIEAAAEEIADLVPEARIGVGHGQMPKRDLEQVMSDFYHRRLNVLVCTTIIETGLDVPNANTIIIERADKFGLAQLHQLRGRVGRSHRQAYAYLLTPHPKSMTADAKKRLDAIEASGELGIGFTLATHDMEIRGAGELLGDDQSGQIESIGFSLYMELLERAVSAMRSGQSPSVNNPLEPVSQEVNLHAATLIPEDYLPDVHTRLILYKRISAAKTQNQLDDLQVEIIDRFGLLPLPLKRLFAVTGLKLASQSLGLAKLDIGPERGKLEFNQATKVDPIKIVNLVQRQPNSYKMEGAAVLRVIQDLPDFDQRVAFAQRLLNDLMPDIEAAA
ncbi:MAG: transcription-repair coupling factor [Pseudomonadaceae bacterium]|nr:transcription-repair coupling factor [Pseudomonadaceae bacterium]